MIFKRVTLDGIQAGRIDRAFRRWPVPRVRAGGTQLTAVGRLSFHSIEEMAPADLTEGDATQAGYADLADLREALPDEDSGPLWRIAFSLAVDDPARVMREQDRLAPRDIATFGQQLDRLDKASSHGTWTRVILRLVEARPGAPAATLAAEREREPVVFKRDLKKLETLGLIESFLAGYRLSPHGVALLESMA